MLHFVNVHGCMDHPLLHRVLPVLSGSRADDCLMAGGKDLYNFTIMFRELARGNTVCQHFGISCLSGFSSFPSPAAEREGETVWAKEKPK